MINEWDHNKIIKVDTAKQRNYLFGKNTQSLELARTQGFSIIQWQSPQSEKPQDATYVIIKEPAGLGLGFVCTDAAYENGRFWYVSPDFKPIPEKNVLLWAYAPFDDRLNMLGQILPEYKAPHIEE